MFWMYSFIWACLEIMQNKNILFISDIYLDLFSFSLHNTSYFTSSSSLAPMSHWLLKKLYRGQKRLFGWKWQWMKNKFNWMHRFFSHKKIEREFWKHIFTYLYIYVSVYNIYIQYVCFYFVPCLNVRQWWYFGSK